METPFESCDPRRLSELIETGAVGPATPLSEAAGSRIGRYKLLQLIGEGGFGSVFMAEQETPVVRKVAIKIIKLGMDTRQVIARFDAERQALAMMDHPNIAKVLDAGATETGRPYFVMELVRGIPITEYCDQNHLSLRHRLELLLPVCRAIQHAHQKGIIHRDIKPSNVLVTLHDDMPMPKVIDFGIAKATNARLTEHTLFTEFRQFIGTPQYMSPEQAQISSLDVDTRSDIYSLGVMLYQLLTGTTPFDPKQLLRAGYGEIQRVIREVEPPKPSTRISTLGAESSSIASLRGTDPKRLGALVAGELDWIVMRCLEKDRTRRYETANALMRDLERYLADEAVEACPPSAGYRLRKWVRRHRSGAALAAAMATALLLGLAGTSIGLARARRAELIAVHERDRAQRAQAEEAAQRRAAEAARKSAERISDFLQDVLAAPSPYQANRSVVTAPDVLDEAVRRLDAGALAELPPTELAIRRRLGTIYRQIGRPKEGAIQVRQSLDLARRTYGEESEQTAQALSDYALYGGLMPRETEAAFHQSLEIYRRVRGADAPETARVMILLGWLDAYLHGRDATTAEALMTQALRILRRHLNGPDLADALYTVAVVLSDERKCAEAQRYLTESIQLLEQAMGTDHPRLAPRWVFQASLDVSQKNWGGAQEDLRRCRALVDRYFRGVEFPQAAEVASLSAQILVAQHRFAEAEPLAIEYQQRVNSQQPRPDALSVIDAARLLADVYEGLGNTALATEWRQKQGRASIAWLEVQVADDVRLEGMSAVAKWRERGSLFGRLGRFAEASAELSRVMEADPDNFNVWAQALPMLLQEGQDAEYRRLRSEALRHFENHANGRVVERILKRALIAPIAGDDLQRAKAMIDRVLPADPDFDFCLVKAMAAYRDGNPVAALSWLQRADPGGRMDCAAESALFQAMAHHQLGHEQLAHAELKRGTQIIETKLPKPGEADLGYWFDEWIMNQRVRREAQALINGDESTTQPVSARPHSGIRIQPG